MVGPVSVRVLAPAGLREDLHDALGDERAGRLRELLVTRAAAAARDALGDAAVTVDGAGAPGSPTPPRGSTGERVTAAAAALGAGERLLVAVPQLPAWRADVLRAALDDLDDGCAASVGAIFEGGFYLLALTGPVPAALQLDAREWADRNTPGRVMLAAAEDGLEIGMLRIERGLRTAADMAALLADPLTDPELRELLGR